MDDFLAELRKLGFDPPTFRLDGTVQRFGRNGGKDNAWLIGWQNHSTKDGSLYIVCEFGDWRTGERHLYKPAKLASADNAAIKRQLEEAKRRAEADKVVRHQEAAEKAEKRWPSARDAGTTPYLERKLIPALFGTRIWQEIVQVPMRDLDGKLWGLQYIHPDGVKRFMTGQRVEGTCHIIGDLKGEAFLCEGFATGVSIHLATKTPVIVAFNAGNLLTMAKDLRRRYPDLRITVCGDDDRWNQVNAGREKAQKAALMAHGPVLFPVFESDDGKPTDFNDLHLREGLDAVRRQLESEVEIEAGFIPLGYDEGTYFFYHVPSRDIVKASTFSKNQLYQIAPAHYWDERYPTNSGRGDADAAMNDLIQLSRRVGPFDSSRIRGTGVWLDESRVVINTGHSLIVDGREMGLSSLKSWYIYVQTRNRLPPLSLPLTAAETAPLIVACKGLKWRDPKSAYLLMGWLAIARVAGALPVRPHVWITGGKGTGKSTVMERIVAPCLGSPKGKVYLQGASTEAGVRQRVKSSSVPIIFDEFETSGDASQSRVDAVVELMRSSWSSSQGAVVKGSASGFSVEYLLFFAGLVSSVRVNLTNDADRSRFSILELLPHGDDANQWATQKRALAALNEAFGERLFARSARLVKVIAASAERIGEALSGVVSQRFGQQVGTLLAGYWSLISDDVIPIDQAEALAHGMDLREEQAEAALTDEQECLDHLMTWKIHIKVTAPGTLSEYGRDLSLADAIADGYHDQVKAYGIIVENDHLLIANDHAELRRIYATTRWPKWSASLRRLKGAELTGAKWFGKDCIKRAVKIPRILV